ncbi:MAG: hypothetical protein NTV80_04245 [Verrucomicrobia bacterium]|nr:hypothetical protein [Verrucomicrobiota bacterium]
MKTQHLRTLALSLISVSITSSALSQSTITSPPLGSRLAFPAFTLSWRPVNAAEHVLYIGSRQGQYDIYAASLGTGTSASLTWSQGRPAGCWFRLWSKVPQGGSFSNSTPNGLFTWVFSDAYYALVQPPPAQPQSAQPALVNAFLNAAAAKGVGAYVGECKGFLKTTFDQAAWGFRLSTGRYPVMPFNVRNDISVVNWQWLDSSDSAFIKVAEVLPTLTTEQKRVALMALLRQVQRGDVLQMVWRRSTSAQDQTGANASEYGPHTFAFLSNYQSDTAAMSWIHSNMRGDGKMEMGSTWWWNIAQTPDTLIVRIAARFGGCTLYRVRSDVFTR